MPSLPKGLKEISDLVGGVVTASPTIDRGDRAIAKLVADIRGQLNEAVQQDKISVRGLARKLNVSPAAVSRQLRAEGDIRASTAAIIANALNRDWTVTLTERPTMAVTSGNGCISQGAAIVEPLAVSSPVKSITPHAQWVGSATVSVPGTAKPSYTIAGKTA